MPKLSPFVVVISLGQQVKGLVRGRREEVVQRRRDEVVRGRREESVGVRREEGVGGRREKATNYWGEEEEDISASLPSIVDSLGGSSTILMKPSFMIKCTLLSDFSSPDKARGNLTKGSRVKGKRVIAPQMHPILGVTMLLAGICFSELKLFGPKYRLHPRIPKHSSGQNRYLA